MDNFPGRKEDCTATAQNAAERVLDWPTNGCDGKNPNWTPCFGNSRQPSGRNSKTLNEKAPAPQGHESKSPQLVPPEKLPRPMGCVRRQAQAGQGRCDPPGSRIAHRGTVGPQQEDHGMLVTAPKQPRVFETAPDAARSLHGKSQESTT